MIRKPKKNNKAKRVLGTATAPLRIGLGLVGVGVLVTGVVILLGAAAIDGALMEPGKEENDKV